MPKRIISPGKTVRVVTIKTTKKPQQVGAAPSSSNTLPVRVVPNKNGGGTRRIYYG